MKNTKSVRINTPLYKHVQELVKKNKKIGKYPYTVTQFVDDATRYFVEQKENIKDMCHECGYIIPKSDNYCHHCYGKPEEFKNE